MGHRVRLIPPQYVKRSKTDRADAGAICEAAGRPLSPRANIVIDL